MNLNEAIAARHSVRSFKDKAIDAQAAAELQELIKECNRLSGFNIQLCLNEPKAFDSTMAHYGKFRNCKNYIALIGPKKDEQTCGYYGEKLVLTRGRVSAEYRKTVCMNLLGDFLAEKGI